MSSSEEIAELIAGHLPAEDSNINEKVEDGAKRSSLLLLPPDEIQKGMDFDFRKILEGTDIDGLFIHTKDIRRDVYYVLSNTNDLKRYCSNIVKEFIAYSKKTVFPRGSRKFDILIGLSFFNATPLPDYSRYALPEVICKVVNIPLFPELRLECNSKDSNKSTKRKVGIQLSQEPIGFQHIVVSAIPESSTDSSSVASSDSNELLDFIPAKKARIEKKNNPDYQKVCQMAKNINPNSHHNNMVRDSRIFCQVDILIYIDSTDRNIGINVSKHLGLISVEDIFETSMLKFEKAKNPTSKMYKLLQTNIAIKLMKGFNNIIVTSNLLVWSHIWANVRGVISDGSNLLGSNDMSMTDYYVCVKKKDYDFTLTCITAITEIINNSLGFDISVVVEYEEPHKQVSVVNFPITSIIPLYIIRYFVQIFFRKFNSNKKLDELFN